MKPITDKQVEDLINIKLKPIFDKFNDVSKNIDSKNNFLELIDKSISFEIDVGKEIKFLDTAELGDILYSFIFEQNSSLKEMTQPEMITGIINESLYSSHEHLMSDEVFVASITRWLKYHVIPYIYENKRNYELKEKSFSEKLKDKGVKLPSQNLYNEKYQLIENLIIKELQKSIVSDLFRPMDLNAILYVLISEKNLSLVDIIHNPVHIETIMNSSIIDKYTIDENKTEITTFLRKTLIPKIFDELGIQEKSTETLTSEMFGGIPLKLEIITKSEISSCIFPLNLNYISKEDFEKLPKNIVDILYTYFNNEENISEDEITMYSDYVYDRIFIKSKQEFSKEFKETVFQWLNRAVIPCIIKKIEEEKPKEEYISDFKQIEFEINKYSSLYQRMEKIVRDFYDSFYLPQHHLCLYYTYYVLRLKGNHDFDFEFRELENKLYKDFYNYGIFACIGELRHFLGTFHYKEQLNKNDIEIGDYIKHSYDGTRVITFKPGFKKIITEVSNCVGIDVKDIYKIINIERMHLYTNAHYNDLPDNDEKENKIIRDTEFLYLIEKYFGYFTRPDMILKVSLKTFNISKENKIKCHWSESYGGEAWGSIAKTMLHRSNLVSKTIFVDTCWSLQHNTNLFLDKVNCYDCKDNSLSLLKHYLTEIKDGLFKNVYECAIKHNNKLDRFIYKNLILENDKSVPDDIIPDFYKEKHKYTEREIHRKDDRVSSELFEVDDEPRERLPEKEDFDITQYSDEDKYKLYEELDDVYDLKNATIVIAYGVNVGVIANMIRIPNESNPSVIIIIESSRYRYITDLDSIMKYMNEHYPLSAYQEIQPTKSEETKDYPEEQAENEISKLEDIIELNINNLENPEMKEIILKYQTHVFADELHNFIYILKYNTLEIRQRLDLLIEKGFYNMETDNLVDDPEVISLLKLWITDYLIDDLMKGTPLQPGGLDVLFS